MTNELIQSGVQLMFVGMGIVFVFLSLLIVSVNMLSSLVGRYLPENVSSNVVAPASMPPPSASPTQVEASADVIAAISAAVTYHRGLKNK